MNKYLKVGLFCILILLFLIAAMQIFGQQQHPAEVGKTARTVPINFKTSIDFYNDTNRLVKLFWLDQNGTRVFIINLKPREHTTATTYLSQPWLVTDESDNAFALYYPDAQPREIRIGGTETSSTNRPRRDYDDEDEFDERYFRGKYDETPIKICQGQDVPRSYLIISAQADLGCPNWDAVSSNAYTIKRPSLTEATLVCSNQGTPPGFVVVKVQANLSCPNWSPTGSNSYVIRRPRDTERICDSSPFPRRYVITRTFADLGCPNWNAVGTNAKEIRRVN